MTNCVIFECVFVAFLGLFVLKVDSKLTRSVICDVNLALLLSRMCTKLLENERGSYLFWGQKSFSAAILLASKTRLVATWKISLQDFLSSGVLLEKNEANYFSKSFRLVQTTSPMKRAWAWVVNLTVMDWFWAFWKENVLNRKSHHEKAPTLLCKNL